MLWLASHLCGRVADKSGPYRVSPEGIASTPEAESDWTRPPPPVDVRGFVLHSTGSSDHVTLQFVPPGEYEQEHD